MKNFNRAIEYFESLTQKMQFKIILIAGFTLWLGTLVALENDLRYMLWLTACSMTIYFFVKAFKSRERRKNKDADARHE